MTAKATLKKNNRARYFDWFILAGMLMNALVVLILVGVWVFKTFMV